MEKISLFLVRPPLWSEKNKNLKIKKGSMFFDIVIYLFLNFELFSRLICLMEATPLNVTHRFKGNQESYNSVP
jgi:hypothetical protein